MTESWYTLSATLELYFILTYDVQVKSPAVQFKSFKKHPAFISSASLKYFNCPCERLCCKQDPLAVGMFSDFMSLCGTLNATVGWCADKLALKFPFCEAFKSWNSSYTQPGSIGPVTSSVYNYKETTPLVAD